MHSTAVLYKYTHYIHGGTVQRLRNSLECTHKQCLNANTPHTGDRTTMYSVLPYGVTDIMPLLGLL